MAFNVSGLEGNENSDYERLASTGNRWSATWGAFKSSFGKIVLINLFILLSFAPGIAIVIFRAAWISNLGGIYPFNSNTGVGYPAYPDTQGLTQSVYLSADLLFYSLLIVAGFIASVGISGGAYSIRKILQTEGKFTIKGFFHGVKICYFNTVLPVTIFMVFLFATKIIGDWKDLVIAQGGSGGGPITAYVFIIIATVLVGIYSAWLLSVGTTYKTSFLQLFKNSFIFFISTPLQTVFISALALMPVWLYMIGLAANIFKIVAYVVFVVFGFSYVLLVWMSFSQWTFDLFITPNVKEKQPQKLSQAEIVDSAASSRELLAAGKSELMSVPILPIQNVAPIKKIGVSFTREDMLRVEEERDKLKKSISDYEDEHKNDKAFAEYNKLFAEREKALKEENGKKGKKKKVSSANLLK